LPRNNSISQMKPPHSSKKESLPEKKLTSNNSTNYLFGPKAQLIQESNPKPKTDKLDQNLAEISSAGTMKAFGPTNKMIGQKGADLYQK